MLAGANPRLAHSAGLWMTNQLRIADPADGRTSTSPCRGRLCKLRLHQIDNAFASYKYSVLVPA